MRITTQKGFKGIDQNLKIQSNLETASNMINFKVTNSGSLERRGDIVKVYTDQIGLIDDIWCGSVNGVEAVVFAVKGRLYRMTPRQIPASPIFIGEIGDGDTMMFGFANMLYIKSDQNYLRYDGENLLTVEGYIPLVALSCSPDGSGEIFEQINLICDKRRQLFSPDGKSIDYYLAEKDIDQIVSVKLEGEEITDYTLSETRDFVRFNSPIKEGLNTLEIIYSKSHDESDRMRIFGCKRVMLFGGNSDGRIFLWGNDQFPNYRFHSDLANGIPSAEYFPVNAFTVIGNNKINSIIQQYDRMLIFTESQAFYSYCELRDDGLGNRVSSFPVFSLNGSKGCLIETAGCVIDNRPVTLCNDGLNMWESTSLPDEKNAVCFSQNLEGSIKSIIIGDRNSVNLFDFQAHRELFFIYGDLAYIYNYGNGVWYIYDGFGGSHHRVCGNLIYFAKNNSIYLYGDGVGCENPLDAFWESGFTSVGQGAGRVDLVGLEADIYVDGEIGLDFEFIKSDGSVVSKRRYNFGEGAGGFKRISLRPSLKRCMPFKIKVTQIGKGYFGLHGMTVKTREKERSGRIGLR